MAYNIPMDLCVNFDDGMQLMLGGKTIRIQVKVLEISDPRSRRQMSSDCNDLKFCKWLYSSFSGNTTGKLQPADVLLMRPFKCAVQHQFKQCAVNRLSCNFQLE
ncbi:hypothetical protein R1flu_023274 [Riccia fluitans]|uniref:Uncharacterized protein n=1 Tax=Riccia fluitans TaxID=41844 RepID=A0ABD1XRK9_9MARC